MSLLEVPSGRVLALSESAAAFLDVDQRDDLFELNALAYVTKPDEVQQAFELVAEGALDGYQARGELCSTTGEPITAHVSVRVVRRVGSAAYAVAVLAPVFGQPEGFDARPDEITRFAGTMNDAHRIEHVSSESTEVLGRTTNELLLVSLLDIVHPDDAATLVRAFEKAANDDTQVTLLGRFANSEGAWRRLRLVIRPIGHENQRFGFMLTPVGDSPSVNDAERIAELEQRLQRIAQEVQAAGMLEGFGQLPKFAQVEGLDNLTARQWEIVSRLLRGQRVPAIAQSMYLSQSTVRNHLSAIFKKVGVHSQTELLRLLRAE
ncbi:MAG TPA: LuxR C-terminal-related transcriptional regulator [Acidimicrobiales bacterium]|nr:LuxR C-terminal-related transcriptional regulator [Acidimicrobiales bacterium]